MSQPTKLILALLCGASLLAPFSAAATNKVYTPYIEKGELEIEWRAGILQDDDDDTDGEQKHKLGIGYGFTDWWFSEVYGEWEESGASGSDMEFEGIEWENLFAFTEPGQYWVDAGGLLEYVFADDGDAPDKIEAKLLLAKDIGQFGHALNLIAEREVGENSSHDIETGLAWATRYRMNPMFEPGFEYYAEFGAIDDIGSFDDQGHQLGPVIQGKLPLTAISATQHLKYNVGYLFGLSDGAPDGELKWILEYEMRF